MPYIPKSKILTNLYTTGGEYIIKATQENYTGYYHKYYNDTVYTGRTPDDQYIQQLEVVQKIESFQTSLESVGATFVEDPDPEINTQQWNSGMNSLYTLLKTGNANQVWKQKLPQPYIYTPSEQDYNLGEIRRYFVKKTNELRYVEVDQKTHNSILSQDSTYAWQYYIAFNLPWLIAGDKTKVATVNKNMVDLTQQTYNIRGLSEFLKQDYLKFYK